MLLPDGYYRVICARVNEYFFIAFGDSIGFVYERSGAALALSE
jgi:hypothetical protein